MWRSAPRSSPITGEELLHIALARVVTRCSAIAAIPLIVRLTVCVTHTSFCRMDDEDVVWLLDLPLAILLLGCAVALNGWFVWRMLLFNYDANGDGVIDDGEVKEIERDVRKLEAEVRRRAKEVGNNICSLADAAGKMDESHKAEDISNLDAKGYALLVEEEERHQRARMPSYEDLSRIDAMRGHPATQLRAATLSA